MLFIYLINITKVLYSVISRTCNFPRSSSAT